MSGPTVGFFGKLPSHGDFLERRIAPAFRDVWDEWLQQCVAASRTALQERWLDIYLTSPVWRFFITEGIAAAASYGGILMPSVDRVGRYFPLTIVAELPAAVAPLHFAQTAERWLRHLEELAVEALQAPDFDLHAFDEALIDSGSRLANLRIQTVAAAFPGHAKQWWCAIPSASALAPGLASLLLGGAQRSFRPMSLWWTDGSNRVSPSALLVRSLPEPGSFPAMLAGTWAQGGWAGDVSNGEDISLAPERASFSVRSGGATAKGNIRKINQDNYAANDHIAVWAVADGMGGGQGGDIASRMIADALHGLEPVATLNAAMQSVSVALERVNADLCRRNRGRFSDEVTASTVIALAVRGGEWAVAWVGDSRAYQLRDGELIALTVDHSLQNHPAQTDAPALEPFCRDGIITRAVGAEPLLRVDQVSGDVQAGDRFLLCSDGLYSSLTPEEIIDALVSGDAQAAARKLIEAATAVGASDDATAVVVEVCGEA